jgi:predicted small lipoprotein YifL
MKKRTPSALAALVAAALLAGCGVKGDPELPPDKADGFPRTYPQGAVPTDERPENIFVDRLR